MGRQTRRSQACPPPTPTPGWIQSPQSETVRGMVRKTGSHRGSRPRAETSDPELGRLKGRRIEEAGRDRAPRRGAEPAHRRRLGARRRRARPERESWCDAGSSREAATAGRGNGTLRPQPCSCGHWRVEGVGVEPTGIEGRERWRGDERGARVI